MERAGRDLAAEGDGHLSVLSGGPLLGPEHLADGLHPNDRGTPGSRRRWRRP